MLQHSATTSSLHIAILVPCYNEATTVAKVVADFKLALPHATVYVYDNNSRDNTSAIALAAGAVVVPEFLGARPEGSVSKLSTYKDGIKILWMIFKLIKLERPSLFFNTFGIIAALFSLAIFAPVLRDYLNTGLLPRLPTAILSGFLMSLAILSAICGLILTSVTQGRREIKQLSFLATPRFRHTNP